MYTDVAILGNQNAAQLFVISFGAHGVEGFAESAIQTGLLRDEIGNRMSPSTEIMMTYAFNTHVFADLHRLNENNVDLNHSFVDRQSQNLEKSGHEELAGAMDPKSVILLGEVESRCRCFWYTLTEGKLVFGKSVKKNVAFGSTSA